MANDWIDAGYWPDACLLRRAAAPGAAGRAAPRGGRGDGSARCSSPARTPEARTRWRQRIEAEAALRGLGRAWCPSDVPVPDGGRWSERTPSAQFRLLDGDPGKDDRGRIPVPRNAQVLWAQHKYSILARDPGRYRELGRAVARGQLDFGQLATELTGWLDTVPTPGGLRNALQHMWGHVAQWQPPPRDAGEAWSSPRLLAETRWRAMAGADEYLLHSTALGELAAWLPGKMGSE